MVKRRKLWILIAAAIAIVALFLLSTSLSNVELLPGKPFPWGLFSFDSAEPPAYPAMGDNMLLITILRIFMLILFPIGILYMIFTKEGRKRALRTLLQVFLFMLLLSVVLQRQADLVEVPQEGVPESFPAEEIQMEPPPEFVAGDMQDITTTLTLVLAIGLTIVIITALYILWWRRRPMQDTTLLDLAREAQDALDDIQAGGSLRNAVIRCYAEMSRVISEKRNIQRGLTVTSHEFEEHLVKAGLPKMPVQELTHLFEAARYGDHDPGPTEEQRAVACLSSIVTAVAELSQ